MELNYIIKKSELSIKQILKEHFQMSDRYILKLKNNKCILVNGLPVFINHPIHVGDTLTIKDNISEESPNIISNENILLNIIYEDNYLLVVNKPTNLPVHPSVLHYNDSLSNAVKAYFEKINLKRKIHPVNRLDKDTSGIVIFAKNEYIQECLIKQMKNGTFQKFYIALLTGSLENESGTIDFPIARKPGSIMERIVSADGEIAITNYKVIKHLNNMTQVEFSLKTGRTHQLRVHSKHIGHPIVGDSLYGTSSTLINRQALHAYKIEFIHPISKTVLCLTAPLPEDIKSVIEKK